MVSDIFFGGRGVGVAMKIPSHPRVMGTALPWYRQLRGSNHRHANVYGMGLKVCAAVYIGKRCTIFMLNRASYMGGIHKLSQAYL